MSHPPETIAVLHVEDDEEFGGLVASLLERGDDRFDVVSAATAAEALDRLEDRTFDCVVSDYNLPEMDGLAFLEAVRERSDELPFVLFTGRGSEEVASEAISAGVTDYLQKGRGTGQFQLLANRIENAVTQYRSERTAEEFERRLLEIAGNTSDVLWMFTADWTELLFVNPAYEEIWGRSVEALEADPTDFLAGIHPDDRPLVEEAMARLSDGESVNVEYRVNPTEGYGRWVWVQGDSVVDDGEVVRVVGYAREITERKAHERQLGALHETTRRLIRADDRMAVADVATEAASDVLGLSANSVYLADESGSALEPVSNTREVEEVVGTLPTFGPGDGLAWQVFDAREAQLFEDVSAAEDAYNPATKIRSELILPLGDHGVFMAGSTAVGAYDERTVTLARVLTANVEAALDRVQGAERLRVRERKIQELQSRTRWLIRASTKEGIAKVAVAAARTTLELPLSSVHLVDEPGERLEPVAATEELRDHFGTPPAYHRTEPARSADAVVWTAFEDGESVVFEDVREHATLSADETPAGSGIIHPLGEHGVFVATSTEPRAFDDADVALTRILAAVVTAALDRTAREAFLRERKEQLEHETDRLEAFASVVSHDLRNPLNVAQGRLELALETGDDEHLDDVARAHDRMRALIDDLLTLAREGESASAVEPVDLAWAVERCWSNVETGSATLSVEARRAVVADERRLLQLLENLLRNAVDHGSTSPRTRSEDAVEHGSTSRRASPDDAAEHGCTGVTVTVGDLDGGFFVEDDGAGIPESERTAVFDAGYSTASEGTGFGLSIVRQTAEAHGWEIRAGRAESGGARFEITGVERPR